MALRRAANLGVAMLVLAAAAGALGGAPAPVDANQGGSWSVIVPMVIVEGEEFEVSVSFGGPPGGLPSLSLFVQDDSEALVELKSEQTIYKPGAGTGISNTWTLTALSDGTAELRAYVYYEKMFPCPEDVEPCVPPVMSFVGEEHEFSVEILPREEAPPQPGDVNGDGVVDSRDALLILQYDAGLIDEPEMADLNGDGVVDSRDALLILQYDAGMIDNLG